jgi:hypothetical protein
VRADDGDFGDEIDDRVIAAMPIPSTLYEPPAREVRPVFQRLDEGRYRLVSDGLGLTLELDRVRRKWDEWLGELTVRCTWPGARTINGILSRSDLNLSQLRARQERAKHLAERAQASDLDWLALLEELCLRTIETESAGTPSVSLLSIPRPTADRSIIAAGIPLLMDHPQILFAPGGTGKSLLALHLVGELARAGRKPLVADFETDGG